MKFKLEELEKLGIFKKVTMDDENSFHLFCELSNLEYEDLGLMACPRGNDITKADWEVTLFPYSHQIKTIEDIKKLVQVLC